MAPRLPQFAEPLIDPLQAPVPRPWQDALGLANDSVHASNEAMAPSWLTNVKHARTRDKVRRPGARCARAHSRVYGCARAAFGDCLADIAMDAPRLAASLVDSSQCSPASNSQARSKAHPAASSSTS